MLIMKVDYKNVDTRLRDEFIKYMKRWFNIAINEYFVDYEVFPTFLTVMSKNVKDIKILEDVVDVFVKRNNIDIIDYINACPSENDGSYKTIVFNESKQKAKLIASFNKNTGNCYYTEELIDEIVDKVIAGLNTKQGATYADAVKAISNDQDLWSGDKNAIMSWLLPNLDSDIYQAIINVTESTLVGTCKRDAIIDIAKKASSIMGND